MNTKFSVKTSALLLFFPYVHCKSFWRFNGTKHMNYLSNQFKHAHLSRWIDKFAQYLHGALCIINLFERWSVNFRQNHCCTVMMTIYVVVRCGISCWNIVWLFTFSQYKVCVCVCGVYAEFIDAAAAACHLIEKELNWICTLFGLNFSSSVW